MPSYILMVTVLDLQNNYWAVILAGLMTPFLIILMRNFMKSIPDALIEAATIDGANDFQIFTKIVIHLAGPGIATVCLFLALGYWNNWYTPMLYLTKPRMYPLQYYLYNILTSAQSAQQSGVSLEGQQFPGESIKMAMAVVATQRSTVFTPIFRSISSKASRSAPLKADGHQPVKFAPAGQVKLRGAQ